MSLATRDLGFGCSLVFQRQPATGNVRAVVKDATGAIVARGGVVAEGAAELSAQQATREWLAAAPMGKTPLHGVRPFDGPFDDGDGDDYNGDGEEDDDD